GIGWYRKQFTLPKKFSGERVFIEFDGVMQNSKIWINGVLLGERPFGYLGLCYDLTPLLNFAGGNVIAVRCDTSAQPASRWYSGAGIYRHVRLVVVNAIHITPDGVFVSSTQVSGARATVNIETAVANESKMLREVTVQTTLISPAGKKV